MKVIPLSEAGIRAGLAGAGTGVRICLYDETDSTNRQAHVLWDETVRDGRIPPVTVLAARAQTAGRGRLGRTFFSPRDSGLYMTLLCPTSLSPDRAVYVTAAAAVSTCEAVEVLTGLAPGIKWVNDLYLHGCKVCGILCEYVASCAPGVPGGLIVGIGLNLTTNAFPEGLRAPAACLADFAPDDLTVDAGLLCGRIAGGLIHMLCDHAEPTALRTDLIRNAYRARLLWVGKTVQCTRGQDSFTGTVQGVDDDFCLTVETADGVRVLDSGEISVRKIVT